MADPSDEILDPAYDSSDPEAIEKKKRHAFRIAKEDERFLKEHLLGTREGRGWLWRFLTRCHIYDSCLGTDTHGTYFLLGERNIGNSLLIDAQKHGDLYAKMVAENGGKS